MIAVKETMNVNVTGIVTGRRGNENPNDHMSDHGRDHTSVAVVGIEIVTMIMIVIVTT
jgi:hypothetical protein